MKKIIYIFFLFIIIAVSCSKENDTDNKLDNYGNSKPVYWAIGNFMDAYFMPANIKLHFKPKNSPYSNPLSIGIDMSDSTGYSDYWQHSIEGYTYIENRIVYEPFSEKYNEYANFYSDTTRVYSHPILSSLYGCTQPLKSITVTADRDLDENHLAGTEINDLFLLKYFRYYSYLKEGYRPSNGFKGLDSISELSDFKGTHLYSTDSHLIFKQEPQIEGKCTFTVKLDFDADPLTGEKREYPPITIEVEF